MGHDSQKNETYKNQEHFAVIFSFVESIDNGVSDAIAATNLRDLSSKSGSIGDIVIVSSLVGAGSNELVELVNFSSLWRMKKNKRTIN